MYHAANKLNPQDVYDVARMAFLEMLLAGITTVGEFHYLHNALDGDPYDDPNLLAKQVIAAAQSVGIRIVLLRTAYLRSGYELGRDPGGSVVARRDGGEHPVVSEAQVARGPLQHRGRPGQGPDRFQRLVAIRRGRVFGGGSHGATVPPIVHQSNY